MGNTLVKSQLEDVKSFLETTVAQLEEFINETTYSKLQQEKSGEESYYKGILSSLRRMLVSCEEGLEACQIVLKMKFLIKPQMKRRYIECIINV